MSQPALVPQTRDPYDPIRLEGGRRVEWHLRVSDTGSHVAGIDIRYNVDVELPGIFSINRLPNGHLDIPQNVFKPSITDRQGARDAVEILSAAEVRAFASRELGSAFLHELEDFASKIRGTYLN